MNLSHITDISSTILALNVKLPHLLHRHRNTPAIKGSAHFAILIPVGKQTEMLIYFNSGLIERVAILLFDLVSRTIIGVRTRIRDIYGQYFDPTQPAGDKKHIRPVNDMIYRLLLREL